MLLPEMLCICVLTLSNGIVQYTVITPAKDPAAMLLEAPMCGLRAVARKL
jgi:hypothetical protein